MRKEKYFKSSKASKKYVRGLENKGWIILDTVETRLPNGKVGYEYNAVLPIRLRK